MAQVKPQLTFFYKASGKKHFIDLTRPSYRWINEVMPRVYDKKGRIAIESKLVNDSYEIYILDEKHGQELKQWILKSNKAFQKQAQKTEWVNAPIFITPEMIKLINN